MVFYSVIGVGHALELPKLSEVCRGNVVQWPDEYASNTTTPSGEEEEKVLLLPDEKRCGAFPSRIESPLLSAVFTEKWLTFDTPLHGETLAQSAFSAVVHTPAT
ncbi:MAG: hypothetical protein ACJ8BW_11780 [Ktedonobacteraceae bacterium]